MKKFLLLCLTTLLCSATMWGADFNAMTDEGVVLYYDIVLDSNDYDFACEVVWDRNYDTGTEEVIIPSQVYNENDGNTYTVVGIGMGAFENRSNLMKVVTPNTVTYIDELAFSMCTSLEEITIGKSTERIGEWAFDECRDLMTINSLNPVPPTLEMSTFSTYDAFVYVPEEGMDAYLEDEFWAQFIIDVYIDESLPIVVTKEATDVTQNSATLHGSISGNTSKITEQGFQYTTGDETILTITAEGEEMNATVENLSAGTTYLFRAYVATDDGNAYGDDKYFTTMSDYDSASGGLYYRITDSSAKECVVTCLYPSTDNGDVYTGEIIIPETVDIDGETYTVTGIDDYAFYYCSKLTSVSIPQTVTSIGATAFGFCGLTELTIPDSVTSIGTYAFRNNTSLLKATVGNGMKTIPEGMFYNCTKVEEVEVPDDITSIGREGFCYCSSLKEFTIPETVTSIGNSAFQHCTTLTSIVIPDGVTSLNYTFSNCTALEEVTLGKNLITLGSEVFYGCSSLKEITIPETVTSIGQYCFVGCTSLTELTIPDAVETINYQAFYRCTGIRELTLGNGLKEIGGYAFGSCTSLIAINIPNSVETIGSWAFVSCTKVTELTLGSGLKEIDANAFEGLTSLPSVIVPNNIEVMSYGIFSDCTGLTEVTLVDGLKEISQLMFSGCTSLPSITIPSSVETIGQDAFEYCSALTEVNLVDGLKEIGYGAFYQCSALPSITIPSSVETIGINAFRNCSALMEVNLSEGLKQIDNSAFYYCSALSSITVPGSVEEVGEEVFAYCTNLTDVTLVDGLKEVGVYMFSRCSKLSSITIPGSVESIGSYAFWFCSNLSEVIIESGVKEIGYYMFNNCEALTSVSLPNTIESISGGAFARCTSLEKIKIPNSVTSLDQSVCTECTSLVEATLGKSVASLEQTEFYNCSNLAKLYSLNPEPASAPYGNVFDKINDHCVLYIPLGSYEAYISKTAQVATSQKVWDGFFYKIIELADVVTLEATDVTETTATLHGTIEVGELCETTTSKGFEIWEEANPDNVIIRLVSGDSLTCVIDGLSLETKYVYHAFVTTATSSSYGDDVEFTTEKVFISPTVQTFEPSDITSSSALIKGYVEAGTEEITEQGFEYWTGNEEPESITSDDNVMALILAGLTPETTYTYRAFAVTESGTTYGEDVEFTTLEDTTTGINGIHISLDDENVEGIYSTSGQKLNTTVKGVNIVRYADGSVKKIYVK